MEKINEVTSKLVKFVYGSNLKVKDCYVRYAQKYVETKTVWSYSSDWWEEKDFYEPILDKAGNKIPEAYFYKYNKSRSINFYDVSYLEKVDLKKVLAKFRKNLDVRCIRFESEYILVFNSATEYTEINIKPFLRDAMLDRLLK
jgi:hypothetical protein